MKEEKIEVLNLWIEEKIEKYSDLARTTAKTEVSWDDLDEVFYEIVAAGR